MSALEREDIFTDLDDLVKFRAILRLYYEETFNAHKFTPSVSDARLIEAHERWTKDLYRVSDIELEGEPLDHYKRCGHLAYWLRRCAPVLALYKYDDYDRITKPSERAQRLILKFANEFPAFDVGFRICRFFEAKRTDTTFSDMVLMLSTSGQRQLADQARTQEILRSVTSRTLDFEYLETICAFLKVKSVSPHALYLVYKSLFYNLVSI